MSCFGHEKGAFTGAEKRKIGKFQFAAGGTIFLDEIGDVSLQMQVKLLRVLQEKHFTPVGSNQEISTDVRVISATNKNLEKMIQNETFRSDLFYRLNVLPINLPPLRERREDILPLIQYLINKFNVLHDKKIKSIDKVALNALRVYHWPGNIRELENVIEHAFILENSDIIHLDALPESIYRSSATISKNELASTDSNRSTLHDITSDLLTDLSELKYPVLKERFEREFIQRALRVFNGRINQTAEHTQMTKVTLLRKLEKYGIDPKEFRG